MTATPDEGLRALLSPRSVAIVGASTDPTRLAGRPVRFLQDAGYGGLIMPVNPKHARVQGLPAYSSLNDLPETPELALIVVPAAAVRKAVTDCARLGIRGVYLLSGGFAETGPEGEALQQEIATLASASGMRVLGPNCLGAYDAKAGFFGTFTSLLQDGGLPVPGPAAIVSQSGAYGVQLGYQMNQRGLGVRYVVTTGNEIDVDAGECIAWLAEQEDVRVIAVYVESIRRGRSFMAGLAKAQRLGKPVVLLKAGFSDAGARAAVSHTAALAGSDGVLDAVLRQYGARRVRSTQEQIDATLACARAPLMRGPRLGIASISGGMGVMAADAAEDAGLEVTPLPAGAQKLLRDILPFGGIGNPVDVTGQAVNDLTMFSRAIDVLVQSGIYDALVVSLTTTPLTMALEAPMRNALETATREYRLTRPVVLVMVARPEVIGAYEAAGFLVFEDTLHAVRALGALWRAPGRNLEGGKLAQARDARSQPAVRALDSVPATPSSSGASSEIEAKAVLRAAGISVLEEWLVNTADEAVAAAVRAGTAVAMKIVSPDIAHKTEIGGVLLGVEGSLGVRAGFDALMTRARSAVPSARLDGVLVSPMAPEGVEVILGFQRDPTFGSVVVFGMGGVHAELFGDVTMQVAPVDEACARQMVSATRVARLLDGWRGQPAADVDALVQAIVQMSDFAVATGDGIESVEINPLRVLPRGHGVLALDALLVRR